MRCIMFILCSYDKQRFVPGCPLQAAHFKVIQSQAIQSQVIQSQVIQSQVQRDAPLWPARPG
jgi:hypothetical protein